MIAAALTGGYTVFVFRHLRCLGRWLIGVAVLSVPLLEADLAIAGLYACWNETGTLIYTDSPAQLKGCQPIGSGGSSRVGAVGGASSSSVTPTVPVPAPPAHVPPVPGSPDATNGPSAMPPSDGPTPTIGTQAGTSSGSAEETPCVSAVNPLNPLSTSPCPVPPRPETSSTP